MAHTKHGIAMAAVAFLLTGCGPLTFPAVERLSEDEQRIVDQSWDNMLSPAGRLERQTLLDTVVAYRLHEHGVDRLTMRSEKHFAGGTVVMEIHFDRLAAAIDRFEVSIYDSTGRLQRHELYRPEEIQAAVAELYNPEEPIATGAPANPELRQRQAAREFRIRAILAATQPADAPAPAGP